MLDLRVVLAACLAAFVFLLAGIGVFATLRIGRESSVAVVKEGGLPPEPARPRVVPRDPRAPLPVPADRARAEEPVPLPAPETTGSIEQVLQVPPSAPVVIEDLLKSLPPPSAPPPVIARIEPPDTPALVEETMPNRKFVAPLPRPKAAEQVRPAPIVARRRVAARPRARHAPAAANPATAAAPPPFNLFNPQPAASVR